MKSLPLLLLAPLALVLPQDPAQEAPPTPAVIKPVVGKPAPVIRLNDHTGKAVTFGAGAKTWQVLACYPKAMTPG
jgi:hypothetical protein